MHNDSNSKRKKTRVGGCVTAPKTRSGLLPQASSQGSEDSESGTSSVQEDTVCEECGGTGEVDEYGYVYPGEPHMALINTRKCICQLPDPDDYDDL